MKSASRSHALRLLLGLHFLKISIGFKTLDCWQFGYTRKDCCNPQHGPTGDSNCWGEDYTYETCCRRASKWDGHIQVFEESWRASLQEHQERQLEDVDWIVIGSGSGGATAATILAEGAPDKKILVLEAGPLEIPSSDEARWFTFSAEWSPTSVRPDLVAKAGKVAGGSARLNGHAYTRGVPTEFGTWLAEDVRAAYIDLESRWSLTLASPQRQQLSPLYSALADSLESKGVMYSMDPHADSVDGSAVFSGVWRTMIGPPHVTRHGDLAGLPGSDPWTDAASKYSNIKIITNALVSRVRFDALGPAVEFLQLHENNTVGSTDPTELKKNQHEMGHMLVRARQEVILSAGVFGTPRLLLASGIGSSEDLGAAELVKIATNNEVGRNLNDHPGITVFIASSIRCPKPWQEYNDPSVSDLGNMVALLNITHNVPSQRGPLDVEFMIVENCMGEPYLLRVRILLLHSKSRGRLRLQSRNPIVPPSVSYDSITDEDDVMQFMDAVTYLNNLMQHPSMQKIDAHLVGVPDVNDFKVFKTWVASSIEGFIHYTGTCRLPRNSVDSESCVDEKLRIRGVPGLRVADASVLESVSGHTDAPSRLAGYMAAKMSLADAHERRSSEAQKSLQHPVPMVGLGTAGWHGEKCVRAVLDYLKAGGRHIDTALYYGNDLEIHQAIVASGVPRSELFLTTKLHPSINNFGYSEATSAIRKSMLQLGVDYLDLVLLHDPGGEDLDMPRGCTGMDWVSCRSETWRALEDLHALGRLRFAGVSNFGISHLTPLLESRSPLRISVNQLEVHPWWQPSHILDFCEKNNIQIVAYGSFGKGTLIGWDATPMQAPQGAPEIVHGLAAHLQTSPGQLLLRWALSHNYAVIPRSSNHDRMLENLAVADERLGEDVISILDGLGANEPLYSSSRYIRDEVRAARAER